jgi:hypothetical protein
MGLSENVIAQIFKAVDDEITKQLNYKLSKFADLVSKRHGIPLKLLLEDMVKTNSAKPSSSEPDMCMGIVKGGNRCKRRGIHGGFCGWHLNQKKEKEARIEMTTQPTVEQVKHTHPIGKPLFLAGCPVCARQQQPQEKLLIGI